tara:strand:+ start:528 stop:1019 length:492 start_codon:yes stop_codon:yes gene_type:complete
MNNPITCYYSSNDYGDKNMLVPMKVDYGVRILVHLASLQPDAIEKATEISKKRHIPEKFLFQISNELIEKKFIKSLRGPNGGYSLAKSPSEISIADIIEGLDKNLSPVSCLYNSDICVISGHCAQQDMWSDVEQTLISKLQTITIKDLADKDRTMINAAKLEN